MEQPRPKKRRRRRSKTPAESTDASRPLLATKFSISVDAARHEEATKERKGDLSFAIVRARAEALGGTYSATVHRNVGVLLASSGAASRKTQRVRKAAKLGVAVVDAAPFLDACEAGAGADTDAHALRVAADDATAAAADGTAASAGRAVDLNDDACWVGATAYDGGCSCACHDVPGAPPFCDWCADIHADRKCDK